MPDDLKGLTMLITGASRGIGRATVIAAARAGARVAFCSRKRDEHVEGLLQELKAHEPFYVAADISDDAQVENLFREVHRVFGHLDVLVANAGASVGGLIPQFTKATWDAQVALNFTGALICAQHAIRGFLAARRPGKVLFLGSLAHHGMWWSTPYCVSKGGLIGLAEQINREHLADGIDAHVIVPGIVRTDLSGTLPDFAVTRYEQNCPARRLGDADEVAQATLFLCQVPAPRASSTVLSGGLLEFTR